MFNRKVLLSVFMWALPLSFFTYQFILRLWPSLMMQQIMHQFSIDATAFGLLASVYYYGYASLQIPIAIALDRYGPRHVVAACVMVCGLATLLFTYTDNWYLALLSRFLIGAGSAVCFLGTSTVISQWFPKEQYSRMVGYSFTVGLLGAVYGGRPVSMLVENFGWQKVSITLAFVALGIGLVTYLFLRSPKGTHLESSASEALKLQDFKKLLHSPIMWTLAVSNLLMVGSLEGFADVWGVNYLMAAYNISKDNAAELASFIFVGMIFGGPLLALFGRRFGNYTVISCCGIGMAALICYLVLGTSAFNWYILAAVFLTIGILCCYQVLVFAAGFDFVSAKLLGVTVAFLNCINMLGGSFFHTIIGWMMDMFWTGAMQDGVRQYTLGSYQYALMVIPVCAVLGACMVWGIRLHTQRQKTAVKIG